MRKIFYLVTCSIFLLTASCATFVRGSRENVVIKTTPFDSIVVTSLGTTCAKNPCTVNVSRKQVFNVTASKEGFQTQTVVVRTRASGLGTAEVAGNIAAGGLIGLGVDAASGATRDHYPNPVIINLVRTGGDTSPSIAPATN